MCDPLWKKKKERERGERRKERETRRRLEARRGLWTRVVQREKSPSAGTVLPERPRVPSYRRPPPSGPDCDVVLGPSGSFAAPIPVLDPKFNPGRPTPLPGLRAFEGEKPHFGLVTRNPVI